MQKISLSENLKENSYPGRGIVMGRSEDGRYAVAAYFRILAFDIFIRKEF